MNSLPSAFEHMLEFNKIIAFQRSVSVCLNPRFSGGALFHQRPFQLDSPALCSWCASSEANCTPCFSLRTHSCRPYRRSITYLHSDFTIRRYLHALLLLFPQAGTALREFFNKEIIV